MNEVLLVLYSRQGCCLCEGLERRLQILPLYKLNPPLHLLVIDIDAVDTPREVQVRYDLHVPVILLEMNKSQPMLEIPRVSPRLNGEGLFQWLQKFLTKTFESD